MAITIGTPKTFADLATYEGQQDMLIVMAQEKYGELPEWVITKIKKIQSEGELKRLAQDLVSRESLDDFALKVHMARAWD